PSVTGPSSRQGPWSTATSRRTPSSPASPRGRSSSSRWSRRPWWEPAPGAGSRWQVRANSPNWHRSAGSEVDTAYVGCLGGGAAPEGQGGAAEPNPRKGWTMSGTVGGDLATLRQLFTT